MDWLCKLFLLEYNVNRIVLFYLYSFEFRLNKSLDMFFYDLKESVSWFEHNDYFVFKYKNKVIVVGISK